MLSASQAERKRCIILTEKGLLPFGIVLLLRLTVKIVPGRSTRVKLFDGPCQVRITQVTVNELLLLFTVLCHEMGQILEMTMLGWASSGFREKTQIAGVLRTTPPKQLGLHGIASSSLRSSL